MVGLVLLPLPDLFFKTTETTAAYPSMNYASYAKEHAVANHTGNRTAFYVPT